MSELKRITYPCTYDCSHQPAMFLAAEGDQPRPLVVALHTWSFGCEEGSQVYAGICKQNNWNLIYPEFRGPNSTPQACGSELVVSDIEDAVHYMKETVNVDPKRVYLIGGSGGGHCSLLLAGRHPELWTAVSAWCPISDIAAWYEQCKDNRFHGYAEHIAKACGGAPTQGSKAATEAQNRSPLTWIHNAAGLIIDIATGIHDGHTGSVPVSQAINAFNALAKPEDRVSQEDIDDIVKNEAIPKHLAAPDPDPAFSQHPIHFRRQSNDVRLTIFEGGHDILASIGLEWLGKQVAGQPADWSRLEGIGAAKADELSK